MGSGANVSTSAPARTVDPLDAVTEETTPGEGADTMVAASLCTIADRAITPTSGESSTTMVERGDTTSMGSPRPVVADDHRGSETPAHAPSATPKTMARSAPIQRRVDARGPAMPQSDRTTAMAYGRTAATCNTGYAASEPDRSRLRIQDHTHFDVGMITTAGMNAAMQRPNHTMCGCGSRLADESPYRTHVRAK